MANSGMRQCIRDVTLYLLFIILFSTLGPLQFGFHLVYPLSTLLDMPTNISSPSSTLLKMYSPANPAKLPMISHPKPTRTYPNVSP